MCFLVQEGANIYLQNKKGISPLELCSSNIAALLTSFMEKQRSVLTLVLQILSMYQAINCYSNAEVFQGTLRSSVLPLVASTTMETIEEV